MSQEIIKRFKFFHFSFFALKVIMLHLWYFIMIEMIKIISSSLLRISNWFILNEFSTIRTVLTRGFRIYKIYPRFLTLDTWKLSRIRKLRSMKTTKNNNETKKSSSASDVKGGTLHFGPCWNKKSCHKILIFSDQSEARISDQLLISKSWPVLRPRKIIRLNWNFEWYQFHFYRTILSTDDF